MILFAMVVFLPLHHCLVGQMEEHLAALVPTLFDRGVEIGCKHVDIVVTVQKPEWYTQRRNVVVTTVQSKMRHQISLGLEELSALLDSGGRGGVCTVSALVAEVGEWDNVDTVARVGAGVVVEQLADAAAAGLTCAVEAAFAALEHDQQELFYVEEGVGEVGPDAHGARILARVLQRDVTKEVFGLDLGRAELAIVVTRHNARQV